LKITNFSVTLFGKEEEKQKTSQKKNLNLSYHVKKKWMQTGFLLLSPHIKKKD